MDKSANIFAKLGPGILFAGAAIGTSHLVQSTRAGAEFGLGLLLIVLLANFLKYPTFRFGPAYVAATGMSLVEGYRQVGRWAVIVLSLSQFAVQAIIIAATAVTTAGIAGAAAGVEIKATYLGVGLIVLALVLQFTGGYRLLDRLTKFFVAIITLATLAATFISLPSVDWSFAGLAPPEFDFATFAFVVALMGFMPSAMDLSILHSLWSVAKTRIEGQEINHQEAMFDFNFGYVGSVVLALCFLFMGAGVMHTAGTAPAQSSVAFADQVISLYTNSLGEWAGLMVGISAFGVMFTTLITILDGFPRMHAAVYHTLRSDDGKVHVSLDGTKLLRTIGIVMSLAAVAILLLLMKNFLGFIDFVTITAFLVGPIIATMNHIVMFGSTVPRAERPSVLMQGWSIMGIVALTLVAVAYLAVRFGVGQ